MDDNILLSDPMTDIFAEMGCRDPLVVEQEEPDDDNDVANENDISAFQTPIHARLLSLFLSDKFADMTIRCGEREFKVHRAIVCSQSSFFDRAMSGNFLVRLCFSPTTCRTGTINQGIRKREPKLWTCPRMTQM